MADGRVGRQRYGVFDDPVGGAFDLVDFFGLQIGGHIFVDDADAADFRQTDRHGGFGDGIHRTGQEGDVEPNPLGQSRGNINVGGNNFAVTWLDENIVEGNGLVANFVLHELPHLME